jgi:hypothetical protein
LLADSQHAAAVPGVLKGIIDESGSASLDYFSSKKNVVQSDIKGLARRSGR